MNEWRLLHEYAVHKSDDAFRRLVERYIDLVYWTCRRNVRDAQTAEDATQAVFILLAKKAGTITEEISLSGWLFKAARLVARNQARTESRVRTTEQTALLLDYSNGNSGSVSPDIEALLDEAMARLPDQDREVILLRYYDRMSYQDIARETGSTENTVTKRAGRAIDKMKRFCEQRNVVVGSAGFANLLSLWMPGPAPETSKAAVSSVIHTVAGLPSSSFVTSNNPVVRKFQFLAMKSIWYKLAVTGIAGVVVALATVPVCIQARMANRAEMIRVAEIKAAYASIPTEPVPAAVHRHADRKRSPLFAHRSVAEGRQPKPALAAYTLSRPQSGRPSEQPPSQERIDRMAQIRVNSQFQQPQAEMQ